MDGNTLVIGMLRQAGETWGARLWLPDGTLLEASAIGPVEDGFCSDKPLDQASEVQALVRGPDGSLWRVRAERVTYDQDAATG